jgi:hypothetical protein
MVGVVGSSPIAPTKFIALEQAFMRVLALFAFIKAFRNLS